MPSPAQQRSASSAGRPRAVLPGPAPAPQEGSPGDAGLGAQLSPEHPPTPHLGPSIPPLTPAPAVAGCWAAPARAHQPLLGLCEDVDDTFPLRSHRGPVPGQAHHGPGIQQPVAVGVADCGRSRVSAALRPPRLPRPPPSTPLPLRPTPLVTQSLALRCAGFEVCTTRCCMSRHVRFLLRGEARLRCQCPAGPSPPGLCGAPRPGPTVLGLTWLPVQGR